MGRKVIGGETIIAARVRRDIADKLRRLAQLRGIFQSLSRVLRGRREGQEGASTLRLRSIPFSGSAQGLSHGSLSSSGAAFNPFLGFCERARWPSSSGIRIRPFNPFLGFCLEALAYFLWLFYFQSLSRVLLAGPYLLP